MWREREQERDIVTIQEIAVALVAPGTVVVPTKDRFEPNSVITKEDAARYTEEINTPAEIRRRFLETEALKKCAVESGAVVMSHEPTGAYSAGAVQVMAIRSGIVDDSIELQDGERLPTFSIYHFEADAQLEYFTQILSNIQAIEQAYGEIFGKKTRVMATENAAATVSDEKHRLARTVAEPHTQIFAVNDTTQPLDAGMIHPSLKHERRVIKILFGHIAEHLSLMQEELNEKGADSVRVAVRSASPVGYVMQTNIHRSEPISDQASRLNLLMATHHQHYESSAKQLMEDMGKRHPRLRELLLPQPSYKVYTMYNDQGFLEISIAPTLFAQTGVIEALDRALYRDPEAPKFFKAEAEKQKFYQLVEQELKQRSQVGDSLLLQPNSE